MVITTEPAETGVVGRIVTRDPFMIGLDAAMTGYADPFLGAGARA